MPKAPPETERGRPIDRLLRSIAHRRAGGYGLIDAADSHRRKRHGT
jgi:hypothetical protein